MCSKNTEPIQERESERETGERGRKKWEKEKKIEKD